ncbi:hypothetical protein SEA_MEDIUMFRY_41 [Arthrobacter phage MediumFry]|nr:hypothetical protein SEA_MEDIUMFRY_41 [Arthrobacter phage MediumFry]
MFVINECFLCGHESDIPADFVVTESITQQGICADTSACARRQKRDAILLEIKEMAKKPVTHPVDKFSKIALAFCAGFLMSTILACVLFLIGL